jgi:hypothetical protein
MASPLALTPEERSLLLEFFLGGLDLSRLRLYEGGLYSLGSTRAVGSGIYFEPRLRFAERRHTPFFRSLLVHESVHTWQYQRVGARYAVGALRDQLCATLTTGSRRGAYLYRLLPERPLLSYGYERQAQLLQDYYLRRWHGAEAYSREHCLDYARLSREEADAICERRRQELAATALS